MELFYAHYPALEQAFLRYVAQTRRGISPWLVVCASSLIAKRLEGELARTQGTVANIYFMQIPAVLEKLAAETSPAKPLFPQNHLRDFLLKDILRTPGINRYPFSAGFVKKVKASLRDLADSYVTPQVLREHLLDIQNDELLGREGIEHFEWFVRVYEMFLEREQKLTHYEPYAVFFERALTQVPTSAFLRGFEKIIFYGFYDMTGRQLTLLEKMQEGYSPVIFAPYAPVPAYGFAQKFFTTHYLRADTQNHNVNNQDYGALGPAGEYLFGPLKSTPAAQVKIVPGSNLESELFYTAKEILRLVEQEGYAFSDIAVIARQSASCQDALRRVFAQNYIPLNASFSHTLRQTPLGVFLLSLVALPTYNFDRAVLRGVLSSIYLQAPHKEMWQQLLASSPVCHGLDQWLAYTRTQTSPQAHAWGVWLGELANRLEELKRPCTWEEGTKRLVDFLTTYIDMSALSTSQKAVWNQVLQATNSLSQYADICSRCEPEELLQVWQNALDELTFDQAQAVQGGVLFTDAVRARGLSFKVVFLLDLNEKVFPHATPQDPIFWDAYRRLLRDGLGYWVPLRWEQRMEEEKLLFFIGASSARERLYALYAQYDREDKKISPSMFVAELARACELNWTPDTQPVFQIPRRLSECLTFTSVGLLTEPEMARSISLYPSLAPELYKQTGSWAQEPALADTWAVAQAISGQNVSGVFDGCIGPVAGEQLFNYTQSRGGFSPSALQELALCPLKYFFSKALHLEDEPDLQDRQTIPARERGTLFHELLCRFYKQLLQRGQIHELFPTAVQAYMKELFVPLQAQAAHNPFGIYPLAWEVMLEQWAQQLGQFAAEDIAHLENFTPAVFEEKFDRVCVEKLSFSLRGQMDRVDVAHGPTPGARVVDYKSSYKGSAKLAAEFFKNYIFQPFLYTLAAEQLKQVGASTVQSAHLLSWSKSGSDKNYFVQTLSRADFETVKPDAFAFLDELVSLVKQGNFYINPPREQKKEGAVARNGCEYCSYGAICRKASFNCLVRARRQPSGRLLEQHRKQYELRYNTPAKEKGYASGS